MSDLTVEVLSGPCKGTIFALPTPEEKQKLMRMAMIGEEVEIPHNNGFYPYMAVHRVVLTTDDRLFLQFIRAKRKVF